MSRGFSLTQFAKMKTVINSNNSRWKKKSTIPYTMAATAEPDLESFYSGRYIPVG